MIPGSSLFLFLLFALLLFGGCYVLGYFLIRLFNRTKSNPAFSFSEISIGGLLMSVAIFACIQTGFRTILAPIPLLLVCWILTRSRKPTPELKSPLNKTSSTLFVAILGIVISWFYFAKIYFFNPAGSYNLMDYDILFYGRLANNLSETGIESSVIEPIYSQRFGVDPYHYGDVWSIGLCHKIFRIHSGLAASLALYPVICGLFATAIYEYCRELFSVQIGLNIITCIAASMALIYAGFSFTLPGIIPVESLARSVGFMPKIAIPGILIIHIARRLRVFDFDAAIIAVLICGLFYIPVLPALLAGCYLLVLVWAFPNLWNSVKQIKSGFILTLIALGYVVVFYKFIGAKGEPLPSKSSFIAALSAKTAINIFAGTTFQLCTFVLYIIPAIGFLWSKFRLNPKAMYKAWKDNKFYDISFLLIIVVAGSLMWALSYPIAVDTAQFFINILVSVSAIACTITILVLIQSRNKVGWIYAGFLIVLNLYFNGSQLKTTVPVDDYGKTVAFLKDEPDNVRFASLQSNKAFTNIFAMNILVYQPLQYILMFKQGYYNINLNAPSLPIDKIKDYKDQALTMQFSAPFTYYTKNHPTESQDQQMMHFLEENNIKFLSISPDTTLPSVLRPLVKDSLFLAGSKYIVYRIKK